jgi:peptidoglycan/LPS O-acetylase OafA/YrhL
MPPVPIGDFQWQSRFLAKGILGFAAGFFLCSVFRRAPSFLLRFPVVDAVLIGVLTVFVMERQGRISAQYLLYAFPVLILFSASDRGVIPAILKNRIFQWLGERSYSIYLWHILLIGWVAWLIRTVGGHCLPNFPGQGGVKLAILIAVVLACSDLSYRYFEMPCRDWIRGRRS